MPPNKDQSELLSRIAALRHERSTEADERFGQLLDSVDVYVWYTDVLLEAPDVAGRPTVELVDSPLECRELSLWTLLNLALEGLATASECLRAGIAYPGAWLLRNLLEARTNAIFIAHEPTGLAGQRWINYNLHCEARLDRENTQAKQLVNEIKTRFPNDKINRDGWWAKTTDPNGNPKLYRDLTSRSNYVEGLQPPPPGFMTGFMTALRAASHQHELDMTSKANLSVHPMLTGLGASLHPIQILYWGSQATWDILRTDSVCSGLPLSDYVIQAHDQLVDTLVEVGYAQVAQDQ